MTDRKHLSTRQDDRLGREFPDTLHPSGDGLLGKLAVAAVLGVVLAVAGGLTSERPPERVLQEAELPATAAPPAPSEIVTDGQSRREPVDR
jgi:hypothetical protein